ncbi:MAG: type II secretion system secretin GspD [Sulfurovaceae bacterium]|nr:type II secretion system secretin GspD [Sulfurovaceae bacterium]
MKFSKIVLGLLVTLGIQAHADKMSGKMNMEFKDMEIGAWLEMIGKITGKNILINGEVKGKINFVSNKEMEKSELIPLANAILESKKMTLVDRGAYLQVVKIGDAPNKGIALHDDIDSAGMMQTVVFQLNNANAAVIRSKIKPLLNKSAKVISFKKNNLLAIIALPHSLRAVKELIDKIENRQGSVSRIITLNNAYVKDVFPNIQNMAKSLFPQDISSEKVKVMQNQNSNSIILVGKEKNIEKLAPYIEQLDIAKQVDEDLQRMYVIPLENSNVEEMEKILSKLLPQMTGNIRSNSGSIHAVANKGASSGIAPMPVAPSASRTPPMQNKKIKKAVIASDIERNALIVVANSIQIENIRETVRLLDIEKSQVYITAKIIEVNTNLAENIGIKYGFTGGGITSKGIFSLLGNAGAAPLAVSSELLGFMNNTQTNTDKNGNVYTTTNKAFEFESGIKEVFALGAKLDLLKQNGAAQILSEPSILTTNNKESSIYVGRTQSIITQSQQSTAGASSVLNNYSREDIGITLKVKPRLSSNHKVNLEIETTIEDILPGSGTSADRPTTTKRSVKTNAIVNHGETIIVGGLIKSSSGKSSTKVPILGDIPIIGRLFTSNGVSKSKVNVVIYLTPYIINKSSDLTHIRKYLSELDSVQHQFNKIVLDKLEKKRLGIGEERRHVTFATEAKRSFHDTSAQSVVGDSYPSTFTASSPSSVKNRPTPITPSPVYEIETIGSSFSAPIETYTDTTDYSDTMVEDNMRSESIIESINNQNQSINLDQINTGIEYNQNTTFTNE